MTNLTIRQMIAPIKWRAYRFFDNLGLMGRVAIVLLIAAIMLNTWLITPLRHTLSALKETSNVQISSSNHPVDDEQTLQLYLAQFPSQAKRANQIDGVIALATQEQVMLDQVNYKHTLKQANMSQTSMEFTVEATYPEIHHFLNVLLLRMPTVAIESLSMNRPKVDAPKVEARIRLTLFFVNN